MSIAQTDALFVAQIIEKKQMQDFMKLYSGLVERCFMSCAQDFTSKALTAKEVSGARLSEVEVLLTGFLITGYLRAELHGQVPEAQ
jgi:hypothetical protein